MCTATTSPPQAGALEGKTAGTRGGQEGNGLTTLGRWAPTIRHGAENGAATSATIGDGEGGRTSVTTGDADLDAVVAGLGSAFERACAPMAVSTPAGEYVAANDAYCTLTGHSLEVLCTVAGHADAGMALSLPIAAADGGATGDAGQPDSPIPASPDHAAAYTGDRPAFELRDPTAPARLSGTVHDIPWTIEEKVVQVAEDIWQEVWTVVGQAPGPTLRVRVGDTINLTLRNPADATAASAKQCAASGQNRGAEGGRRRPHVGGRGGL